MNKSYIPLHVHSHFSLLDGLNKPYDITNRCIEIGSSACAVTDHGSISSHIQMLTTIKNTCTCGKLKSEHPNRKCSKFECANLKPLLGCEFYVSKEDALTQNDRNRRLVHLPIIARNDAGWRDMVQMVSKSNEKEIFYHKPRLDLDRISGFAQKGNLMAFSGHMGSNMANVLFDSEGDLSNQWRVEGGRLARRFQNDFGKDNFYLEVQLMDNVALPKQKIIAECIRKISKDTGIPCVATPDAHYARKEDARDQRILLCSNMKTTLQQANRPEFGLSGFFRSSQYHIPSHEEMQEWHTEEELDNTLEFASKIESYDKILKAPMLPDFPCPGEINADDYLRHLCREGWKKKVLGVVSQTKYAEYGERVKKELGVLQGAGLSSYFLIVSDIIDFVRDNGWLPGPGRGSCAGSLVSYLVGITAIDPMPYDLIFERFYNAGRNTDERISMPDIDMDVPKYSREHIINYMRKKYGEDRVGQMVTFQTMKGRGAIKDVLRAHGGISFEEMNRITKNITEEHKITDELQKMKEDRGESSIIQWCLENTPKKLDEWCRMDDKGRLVGPLAERFAQAMRLEGTKTVQSKHPAGVIIAPEPLSSMCPMVLDTESGRQNAGFEMEDLESVGGLKFDVLGVTALDKAMGVQQDLSTGEIHEISGITLEQPLYN